jgi:flagellar hook assembly protein FlgD
LNYNLDKEGLIANVAVYDGAGRMVKLLVKNELLGTSGQFLWDGVNENNQKAAIGPYVIVVEITDIEGIVRRIRKTCVLAVKL